MAAQIQAGQLRGRHSDRRIGDIQYDVLENAMALYEAYFRSMGLQPAVARGAARRMAAEQMQSTAAPTKTREQALSELGEYNPPRLFGQRMSLNDALNIPANNPSPEYQAVRNYAHNYATRKAAAEALPVQNPALQNVQPELKEREEKHASEAQQQVRQAASPWGTDQAPPRQAKLDPAQLAAYHLAQYVPKYAQPEKYFNRAETESARAAQGFPQNREAYVNPYISDVVNRIRDEGLRTFNEGIMPALEAKFVRMGQHGGSRHSKLAQNAARDLQSEIMKQQGQALHAGYGQGAQIFNSDQARALANAENIKGLGLAGQASNLADIGALTELGRMKQGHAQQQKDIAFQDWMRQREEPFTRLSQQSALAFGYPSPMTSDSLYYLPPEQPLNKAGQYGSLFGQMLGGLMQQPRARKAGGRVTLNLGRR